MYDAYARIFTRLGLKFRAVEADTGAIGGFASHEFQVLAESGEDAIAFCAGVATTRPTSSRPKALAPAAPRAGAGRGDAEGARRPASRRARTWRALLGLPLARTVKCLMVHARRPGAHAAGARRSHGATR